MPLAAHALADLQAIDIFTHGIYHAAELMSNCHGNRNRFLRPLVPFVYVDIGATDRRAHNANAYVVGSDFGNGNLLQPNAGFGFCLDKRFH